MQDAIQQTKATYPYTFQISELPGNAWLFPQDIQIVSKSSRSGWNNQAPPGVWQLFKLCSCFVIQVSLQVEKKSPTPLFIFLNPTPLIFFSPLDSTG